jgi:hypothetical protein
LSEGPPGTLLPVFPLLNRGKARIEHACEDGLAQVIRATNFANLGRRKRLDGWQTHCFELAQRHLTHDAGIVQPLRRIQNRFSYRLTHAHES